MAVSFSSDSLPDAWGAWRRGVVSVIQRDFSGVLEHIQEEDVDWDAWRPLFDQGRSPEDAVDCAFLRSIQKESDLFEQH